MSPDGCEPAASGAAALHLVARSRLPHAGGHQRTRHGDHVALRAGRPRTRGTRAVRDVLNTANSGALQVRVSLFAKHSTTTTDNLESLT